MADRYESRAFRVHSLPPWRSWVSRVTGMACFAAAVMSGIAIWREPTGVGVVVFGVCVIAGALLVVLPEYFRYHAALWHAPPLPDRIEEAFDETYRNLEEMREALERIVKNLEQLDRESRAAQQSEPGREDPHWQEEVEEALTELRLDCDAIRERLRPVLPEDESTSSRTLPPGMLARALSGAGKGKGFPIENRSESNE